MGTNGKIFGFKPLRDYVLLERLEEDNMTSGGLYIPDTAKEKSSTGKVIVVGPGKDNNKMTVSKDDVVLFSKYAGSEIMLEDKKFLIIHEEEILGIIGE